MTESELRGRSEQRQTRDNSVTWRQEKDKQFNRKMQRRLELKKKITRKQKPSGQQT